ncbi:ribosome hibernation-promoting factor, HPF/YfiA family [Gordonia neofelifaecis]|uniref:Ribosome hibernation promoting factor n=1 Tax=Gordonia neofelifaecis NRRL B-59395 TaxID=644548 RepID=F1YJH0_9ACTN|nr:ribosome-associated translation inhibitor RaiA [Gordonia neofelifaecis]EGD55203.1 ribosomal subunit interface protein [Gordonia neofelifaecis NRRL B-59395]
MTVVHRKGQRESKAAPVERLDLTAAFQLPASIDTSDAGELKAELTMSGRNVEIPDHFRVYMSSKLAKLEHFDTTIFRFEVVLYHEPNPRQAKSAEIVEITARGRGPVVRAQAAGENFYAACELAFDKLHKRLRRAKSRKRIRKDGMHRPTSLAEAAADAPHLLPDEPAAPADPFEDSVDDHQPGQVVRVKDHTSSPMSVDEALYEMELVGHDFYLFHDCETDKPSVVYRRHAFDYGVIRLA